MMKLQNTENALNHRHFKTLLAIILFSALGYVLFVFWAGRGDVANAVANVGYLTIALALLLSLVNYILRFIRWQYYLKTLKCFVPTWESLKIYLSGFALTPTPAKAGEILRSIYLRGYNVSYHTSLGAFFSERLSDLISILFLSGIGLWEYPEARFVCIMTAFIILSALIFIQQKALMIRFQRWIFRNFNTRWSQSTYFMVKTIFAFKNCFNLKRMCIGTVLGIFAWGSEGLAFHYILNKMDVNLPLSISIFIYGFSLLIGAVTFLPGGLGSTEFTMLQLLYIYGVSSADAVVAILLIRMTTLWFSVLLGFATLPFVKRPCY